MVNIKPGEAFVPGRSASQAKALLTMAAERGIDPSVVRATTGGYIVPASLLEDPDEVAEPEAPKAKAPARKRTRKPATKEGA